MISNRVNSIKPSLTIATNMKAQELKRAGRDIIVLAAGEPDFDTPDHIKNAAIKAINDGFIRFILNIFKYLFFLLTSNKYKKKIYYNRISGFYNALIGKKSWYRPNFKN